MDLLAKLKNIENPPTRCQGAGLAINKQQHSLNILEPVLYGPPKAWWVCYHSSRTVFNDILHKNHSEYLKEVTISIIYPFTANTCREVAVVSGVVLDQLMSEHM